LFERKNSAYPYADVLAVLKDNAVDIYDKEFAVTNTREEELNAYLSAGKTAKAVANALLQFDEKYDALKTERGVLDYNDLEHKSLQLLQDKEVVQEIREKYKFVFVDEYQDVNPVQEALIERVSGKNLFLVGDVKQSIYGFRGSRSCYFTQKCQEFHAGAGNDLLLTSNFRSASAVLDAVNAQFSLAMTPSNCGLTYDPMGKNTRYDPYEGRVQVHYLSLDVEKEKGSGEKPQDERGVYSVREHALGNDLEESDNARLIRKIIDEELHRKWYDADSGVERYVRYSDIAVLTRKKKGKITGTISALLNEGVPVSTASEVNICEFSEIKTLIDILLLLDNAEQDVPLCSALLSPMGNMTVGDLAEIRLAYKGERAFRKACKKYVLEKKDFIAYKLRKFYEYYDRLRTLTCVMDAGELLTKIVAETRFETTLLSRESREACLRRIHRFIEESVVDEPLSVHDFLDKLKDMEYEIKYCENGGEDSVKVLTMHSSKGLEYPVVILDNMSASFRHNERDDVFVVDGYALAPRAHDEGNMLRKETLLRRLFKLRETESSIGDELNLYYVGRTRAKYALHVIFDKRGVMPDVRYAKSFADFTDFSVWEQYETQTNILDLEKEERTPLVHNPNEDTVRAIMRAFTWEYGHGGYENLPVKSSATSIMERGERVEFNDESNAERKKTMVDEALEEAGKTSVEAGLAYHAFLEKFNFGLLFDENGVFLETDRLREVVEEAYNTMEDNTLLSVEQLVKILTNPVFAELYGMRLYKERQFLVSLPIKDTYAYKEGVDPTLKEREGENMIFQGAIDLLAVGEDCVRVIDYKYSVKGAEELVAHYEKQLRLYRLATAKILKIPQEKVRCTIVNIYRGFQVDV
jgi:ATP-dependent helicase/nuclease subunit A